MEMIDEALLQRIPTLHEESEVDVDSETLFDQSTLLDGVVRVYATHSQPNHLQPWQRMRQEFSTSSGFIIAGNRILTNAHAVEYGSLIQVKKRQSESKYVARVEAVGHECDLAVLSIEDPTFWEETSALTFGSLPGLLEEVNVIGYPVGGDTISISSGVVSRIEMQEYAQAQSQLLAIQIDAAINPGNSGGPVVNTDGQVIGVAFQSLQEEDIENIGFVVPVPVIHHFLEDIKGNNRYSGVCSLGVRLQSMENEELRKFKKMEIKETGVLIIDIAATSPAASCLKKGDVLLMIDDIRVGNEGSIDLREGNFKERVQLSYHLSQMFPGDIVKCQILRDGIRIPVEVAVSVPKKLIPRTLLKFDNTEIVNNNRVKCSSIVGGSPSYLIIGGLVFISLSREYLDSEFNPDRVTPANFDLWSDEFQILSKADSTEKKENEEIVLLSQVISHRCNIGYETQRNMQLHSFNGIPVENLSHLQKLKLEAYSSIQKSDRTDTACDSFIFQFSNGQLIVLESAATITAQEQVKTNDLLTSNRYNRYHLIT